MWKTDEGRSFPKLPQYTHQRSCSQVMFFSWGQHNLGAKFRALLQQHGSFGSVEMVLKRWKLKMKKLKKCGGWYTKIYLEHEAKWTKSGAQKGMGCSCSLIRGNSISFLRR